MKNRIKRLMHGGLCLVVSTGLLAGCTQDAPKETTNQTPNTPNTTAPAEEKKAEPIRMETVQVWSNNAASKDEDEKMIDDFNNGIGKEQGIAIDYKIYGGDYLNVLNVAAAAGEAPHIFKLTQGNLVQFANAEWSLPIEEMPGGAAFLEKYDGYLQPGYNIIKDKTYTVPAAVSTIGVAYNKDLLKKNGFENPPATWSDLREMAKVITQNGGGNDFGFIEGLKSNGYVSVNGLWHYVASVGTTEFNHQTGRYDFAVMKPLMELWVGMREDGSWFPGVEGLNNDQARAQFAEGNIGFKLSASWDPAVWNTQFPAKMDWGICRPVEDINNRYKDYSYQSISMVFGAKAKEVPEKSMEVFKAFVSDEHIVTLYEGGKAIPYKNELIAQAAAAPGIKNFDAFADLSKAYQYRMNPKGELKLEGETAEVVLSKVILGIMTPDEAVADLDKRYNEALDKAIQEGLDINQFIDKSDTSIR